MHSTLLMLDWARRHVFDLAWVCQKCKEDPALSVSQRQTFSDIYHPAKRLSSLPQAGGIHNVETAIAQLCSACQDASLYDCAGRTDWQQPCGLMQQRMSRLYR